MAYCNSIRRDSIDVTVYIYYREYTDECNSVWRLDPDETPLSWGLDTGGGGMKGLMEVGLKRSGLSLTLDLEERKVRGGGGLR